MTEKELSEAIFWEAEQHIPFEISEVNIDFQIVPSEADAPVDNEGQMDVILVAARKEKMDDYTGLLIIDFIFIFDSKNIDIYNNWIQPSLDE